MTDDIERLLRTSGPHDGGGLPGVEDAVWARIGERQSRTRAGRIRAAAVAMALVLGVANGGLMLLAQRPEPSELRIFTVSAGLSPLGRLDLHG